MLSILAPFMALALVLAAVQLDWIETRTSEDDVTQLIQRNLATGATTDEITSFLDDHGIEHAGIEPAKSSSTVLDAGYPDDAKDIGALIPNTSHTLFSTGDIQIASCCAQTDG